MPGVRPGTRGPAALLPVTGLRAVPRSAPVAGVLTQVAGGGWKVVDRSKEIDV